MRSRPGKRLNPLLEDNYLARIEFAQDGDQELDSPNGKPRPWCSTPTCRPLPSTVGAASGRDPRGRRPSGATIVSWPTTTSCH
jgi:hypothetical protein